MIKIGIVNFHPMERHGFERFISQEKDMTIVFSSANSGDMFIRLFEGVEVDILLIDQDNLPVLDGLGTLRQLKKRFPKIKVILMVDDVSFSNLIEVQSAGANSIYCLRDHEDILFKTIREVHQNEFSYNEYFLKPAV
jgi:two-component system, NarL family, response regulator DegU